MSKYSISNEKMILLNSFGRNFKNRVFINASVAYLKDMVDTTRLTDKEKDLIKNEKVNICSSTVMPCPENESSKIVFHFRLPEGKKKKKRINLTYFHFKNLNNIVRYYEIYNIFFIS